MKMFFRTAFVASAMAVSATGAQVINEDYVLSGGSSGSRTGSSVAIDGGIIAVGAIQSGNSGVNVGSGVVYLYDVFSGLGTHQLSPSNGADGDEFGTSIDISNGLVVVGAPFHDQYDYQSGAAYLYDADTGLFRFQLLPNDDGHRTDWFGSSVGIDENVIVVGVPLDHAMGPNAGSAYLFDATTGTQLHKLFGSGSHFGRTVAIDNGIVAIASSHFINLFDANTGVQTGQLVPDDINVAFHSPSVAINNDIVAFTALGSVYLFNVNTGTQISKLTPSDGPNAESVAIYRGVVAAGSPSAPGDGNSSGSAYLFDVSTGNQIAKLLASSAIPSTRLGFSVAISSGLAVAGAPTDNQFGLTAGSTYVFDLPCLINPADMTGDGELNFFDVSVFLTFFQLNDPIADFNGDGGFNFFDVSAFLNAFAEGCP